MLTTFSIQSGSNGNCYYYSSGGVNLLIDAGISFKVLKERLQKNGIKPWDIHAVIISHDHSDHSKAAGIFSRQMNIPVLISPKTFAAIADKIGRVDEIVHFQPGDIIDIRSIRIHTIPTPHDGVQPACFFIENIKTGINLGVFTDLGYGFQELKKYISQADLLFFESNYDAKMLQENKNYPEFLKRRIRGQKGHLENLEAANLIKNNIDGKLKYLFLSHLSENNNSPGLCFKTHLHAYNRKPTFQLEVASRYSHSELIRI